MQRILETPGIVVALCVVAFGCGVDTRPSSAAEPHQRESEARPRVASETSTERAARAEQPARAQSTVTDATEAFDVRRAMLEPDAHLDEERRCDLGWVGRVAELSGSAAPSDPYPDHATHRVDVRCEADTGGGWADLITTGSDPEDLEVGTWVAVRVLRSHGGFSNYPVLELIEVGGRGRRAAEETAPEPGDDFSALGPRARRRDLACGVDFVGALLPVSARDRRLRPYPDDAFVRLSVKCLHRGGDGWIDLVAAPDVSEQMLAARRGGRITVRLLSLDGGEANRPLARLVQ